MSETSGTRSALRLFAMGAPARIGRCIALLLLFKFKLAASVVVASGLAVLLMAATAATLAAAAADLWPRSNVPVGRVSCD